LEYTALGRSLLCGTRENRFHPGLACGPVRPEGGWGAIFIPIRIQPFTRSQKKGFWQGGVRREEGAGRIFTVIGSIPEKNL